MERGHQFGRRVSDFRAAGKDGLRLPQTGLEHRSHQVWQRLPQPVSAPVGHIKWSHPTIKGP